MIFFQFIQQLHRNLTVGPIGKQITAACTLMLLFFVLSGIYLRWPKRHSFKQWFAIKPQLKGRNFLLGLTCCRSYMGSDCFLSCYGMHRAILVV